jgi:nicotinate-nucleotide pyrophosphorylase (carboxylating)
VFNPPDIRDIVALALAEDLGVAPERFAPHAVATPDLLSRDVTSFSAIGLDSRFAGRIVAREEAIVAGLPVVEAVYNTLSTSAGLFEPIEVFPLVAEGTHVHPGQPVLEVEGVAVAVLAGERTALDFLMQLSGMATETARWVELAGEKLAVCDTRKTAPGLRELSKYAVAVGGGVNHRHGLYDMVLVKDNHVRASGGIMAAVESARLANPTLLVEVEADTIAQAIEAVEAGADLVLLDNMSDVLLGEAVLAVREVAAELDRAVVIEASGNITRDRIPALRSAGVDRVSTSALTMGVRPIDFGLDEAQAS